MSYLLLVMLAVPFATAALTLLTGHRADTAAKGISAGGSALGLALAAVVAAGHLDAHAPLSVAVGGTGGPGPSIDLSLYVDQLSAVMLLLAHGVAFLVQVYSLGYLAHDPRYPSYGALVSLFTGAMSLVVVADDLWVLLVGWELMGACSYFLISHHWELADARAGAVKAFLMTRTADLGLLFAIFWLGNRFDTYRITGVVHGISAGAPARDELLVPALLLTVAVLGKSAQVPFHTWLPDAMPGPTPISALIHAATMVAAGVFLVARVYPLFRSAPTALTLLAFVAAVTMFLAALYATYQRRPQAGAGLVDGQPAGLHVRCAGHRRLVRGGAAPAGPRCLQGAALPRRRLRRARGGRLHVDARDGRPAGQDPGHVRDHDPRLRRPGRCGAAGRVLHQGRDHRRRLAGGQRRAAGVAVGGVAAARLHGGDRGAHRRLLAACLAAGVLRRPRPGGGRRCTTPRR